MGDLWTDGVQWEEQSQDALTESTEKLTVFNTGAVRCSDADSERYDLITPVGLRRLAMTYARGQRGMVLGIGRKAFLPLTF